MSGFNLERKDEGSKIVVSLSGRIDEDATFFELDFVGKTQIVLDMEKVASINSCGIREWIKWVRTVPGESTITYRNCPKVIVDQVNMVAGFLPENGTVESFYVPYYCEKSDTEKTVLFRKGIEFKDDGEIVPPSGVKCDESGEEMEMDIITSKYFKFLQKGHN